MPDKPIEPKEEDDAAKDERPRGKFSWSWATKAVFVFITGIAALFGISAGFNKYIDDRIKTVVTDENYIRRVANEVRPAVIFNGKGNILVDQGALRYLNLPGIRILEYHKEEFRNIPLRILVTPKQHLAYAPLLIPYDQTVSGSEVERTNAVDWVYTISFGAILNPNASPQFRLEILQ